MTYVVEKNFDGAARYARITGREDLADGAHYYGEWVDDVSKATPFKTRATAERTYRAWYHKYYQPLDVLIVEH